MASRPEPAVRRLADAEDGSDPQVPEGVLRGIHDIENGDTASKADLEAVLDC